MAKGATSKKKREDEKRQEPQQRQDSRQREETRQRQQRTQREPSQNNSASSRQTTRRDVAPTAIPVLEERSTPRRSASGRNVASMFPESTAPQTTNIPKVEPIPTTNNQSQGFRDDIDERLRRRTTQGIRLDAEDRIKASDASQYGAEREETTSMPIGTDMAEKGRKMAQRRPERDTQNITMPSGQKGDYQGEGGGRSFEKESNPEKENNLSDIGQQTVDDINKKIDRLSVIPTGTLGAVDQKMSELYNDAEAIRALDNLSDNEKMDYLLDPEHRMSKYEQDYAKSLIDSYLESNPKAKELFNANNANIAQKLRSEMSEEERQEYERIASLANKTSNLSAYAGGLIEKIPFSNTVQKGFNKVDELMGVDEANNFTSNIRNAEKQSPLANMAGEMTTIGAEYNAVNNLLEGAPGIMNATNSIGTALAGGNAAIGGAVGNIIRGTMADIPLDTLTNVIIPGLQEGKSLGEITLDSAKNIGMNTLYNAGAEVIPYLFKGARSVADNEIDDIVDAAKQNEIIPDQAEVDTARQELSQIEAAEDAAKNNTEIMATEGNANPPAVPVNGKVSRLATNTIPKGTNLTPEEYEKNVNLNDFIYESKDEERSVADAWRMIEEEGIDNVKARLLADDSVNLSSSDIDALMSMTRVNNATARALEAEGKIAEARAIREETTAIYKKLRQESTSNAQGLQALVKWTRNTPEGMLMHAENIINGNIEFKGSKLQEALKKFARRHSIDFSPDFERRFLDEAEKLQDITDMDSREAKDIMANLGRMVNDEIPVKLPERLQSFLMDNMLGNFRTLVSRNAGGNVGLNAIEQTMTRPLAAGLDRLVSHKTGVRTQAGLSRAALSEYMHGFANGLADEAHDLRTGLHTARSGENTLETAIRSNRHVFKSKIMDRLDSLVKNGLSLGDRPFYEATYKQTLGDYYRLRDQMGPEIQKLSDAQFEEYAKTAANLNALAAVYQNDSLLSNGLMGIKEGISDFSKGAFGVDILSQFSMPFVKTPANVVDRAIDYSPLGFVRNGIRTAAEGGIGGKNFDQNRFVNETARNIIGTAGTGAGVAAARAGIMSGGYSKDKDEKQAQKDSGMQEYALNLPNNYQMDIGWAPVVGGNLVASAAAYDAYKNNDEGLIPALMSGVEAGGKSLFDQSFFQGMQRLFGTGESYNSDDNIMKNIGNVVKQGLGQGIPSLLRQIAQVKDPYRRDVGNSNADWQFGPLPIDNYTVNNLINNIPIAREHLLAPVVDREGKLQKENQGRNIGSKILEDMFLPGRISHVEPNALDEEAARLSGITSNKDSYMPKVSRSDVDTEDHTLTNEEWVQYQQDYYKSVNELGQKVIESDFYNSLSPLEQEQVLNEMYSEVKTAEKSKYKPAELDGAAKEYSEAESKEEGMQAILEDLEAKHNPYGLSKNNYKEMKANGVDMTPFEGYKQALEAYDLDDNKTYEEAYLQGGADNLSLEHRYQTSLKDNDMNDSGVARNAWMYGGTKGLEDYKTYKDTLTELGLSDNATVKAAYAEGGRDSLIPIAEYNNAFADAGMDTVYTSESAQAAYKAKDLETYKEYRDYIKNTGMDDSLKRWEEYKANGSIDGITEEVAQLHNNLDWDSLGMSNSVYTTMSYNRAVTAIPELTPEVFATTYQAIDGMENSNNSITQKEVLAYLNREGIEDAKEGKAIWSAYLSNPTDATIPVLKGGVWKTQRVNK